MNMECEECSTTFVLGPDGDKVTGCPNCGSPNFRFQQNPMRSDMEVRNGVDPATGKDMGGNPLQEGILADNGWQNRNVRDESFASVQAGWEDEPGDLTFPREWAKPGTQSEEVHDLLAFADSELEGGRSETAAYLKLQALLRRVLPRDEADQIAKNWSATKQDKPGDTTLPNEWVAKQAMDFSFDDDDDLGGLSTGEPTAKFIVMNDGRVLSAKEPTTHEAIAQQNKLGEEFVHSGSLGQLFDDGSTKWFQHSSGIEPAQLQKSVSDHFGTQVQVDQNLQPTSNEERWNVMDSPRKRELETLEGPPKPRFHNPPNPADKEGLIRGGRVDTYSSWQHDEPLDYSSEENFERLAHTLQVIPSEHGLHNEVVAGLQQLGTKINGQEMSPEHSRELIKHWSPLGQMMSPDSQWDTNKGRPVSIEHDDPNRADIARQIVESGNMRPLRDNHHVLYNAHQESVQPHSNGLNEDVIKGLGNIDSYVNDRRVREHHEDIMASHQGEPVTVGASNPEELEVAKRVVSEGGSGPAREYRQQQKAMKQGSIKMSPAPLALLPAAGAAAMSAGRLLLGGGGAARLMRGALGGMIGGGGGGSAPPPAGGSHPTIKPGEISAKVSDSEHPDSVSEIGVNDGDPEKVDAHEVNDGDSGAAYDYAGAGGGGAAQPNANESQFDPEGSAIQRLQALLPMVMEWADKPESGQDDPLIRGLHETLERERPGYLNEHTHEDDTVVEKLRQLHAHTAASYPPNAAGAVPGAAPATPGAPAGTAPGGPGKCPQCASPLTNGQCPNAAQHAQQQQTPGAGVQPGMTARTADDHHQGPQNSEQFKAVSQLLLDGGRQDEIPHLFDAPWEYAEEMASVQNKANIPPADDIAQQEPEPAVEEAPPSATMPVPPMEMQGSIQKALKRYADNVAPRCPNCESGTTSVVAEDGDCKCSACGHEWKGATPADPDQSKETKTAIDHEELHAPPGVPAADREQQRDVSQEQDSSHSWQDDGGTPLQVGQEYELTSEKYDIPDVIRIEAVKPDSIEFTITGTYNLEHRTEISHEEADIEGYVFTAVGGDVEEEEVEEEPIEEHEPTDARMPPGPGDVTDLSRPHSSKVALAPSTPPDAGQTAMPQNIQQQQYQQGPTQGDPTLTQLEGMRAHFTDPGQRSTLDTLIQQYKSNQQRAQQAQQPAQAPQSPPQGIGPQSLQPVAKEADILKEEPTEFFEMNEDQQAEFLGHGDASKAEEWDNTGAFRVGDQWYDGGDGDPVPAATVEEVPDAAPSASREWLMEDTPSQAVDPATLMAPTASTGSSRNIQALAGKKYTPSQQRDFIDEPGVARNADKLDIEDTHYRTNVEGGNADLVSDDELLLGI